MPFFNFLSFILLVFSVFFLLSCSDGQPIQLVAPIPGTNSFVLTKEGKDFWDKLGSSPVTIQLFMGSYRSGKSFILNELLGVSHSNGFAVGPTYKPETKGLWVWGVADDVAVDKRLTKIIYVDSEGINAPNAGEIYDAKLSLLCVFLASNIYFNVLGTMESTTLRPLTEAVRLGALFKNISSTWVLPTIMWINQSPRLVRDVSEDELIEFLVYKNIRTIQSKTSFSLFDNLLKFNCPDPKIMLIPHPNRSWADEDLYKLSKEKGDYSQEYLTAVNKLKQHIKARSALKTFSGTDPIPANELYQHLSVFIKWLETFNDVSETVIRMAIRELIGKCRVLYLNDMAPVSTGDRPQSKEKYQTQHLISEDHATNEYYEGGRSIEGDQVFQEGVKELSSLLSQEYNNILAKRDITLGEYCHKILDNMWRAAVKAYETMEEFETDKKKIMEKFFLLPDCAEVSEQVWKKKVESMYEVEAQILGAQERNLVTTVAIVLLMTFLTIPSSSLSLRVLRLAIILWSLIILSHNTLPLVSLPPQLKVIAQISNKSLGAAINQALKFLSKVFPNLKI